MRSIGVMLLIVGGVMVALGLAFLVAPKMPWLGRLPGDIHYRGRHTTFYFPVTTCVVLSLLLTFILNIVLRFFRR